MKINTKIATTLLGVVTIGIIMLTQHVSLNEATITSTGLPNKPDSQAIENLKLVLNAIYEPCRRHFGRPIYISSAYRCKEVNEAVGGSQTSQHLKGQAIDLDPKVWGGLTTIQLFYFILDSLDFDQCILEGGVNGWVHVSYTKNKNRKQALIYEREK